jgi:hypothetical protein
MDTPGQGALHQLDLAEAELAVLKQELVLQHLLDTREPTADASAQLERLREVVARLSAGDGPLAGKSERVEAAA